MKIPYYEIHAFTGPGLKGNPAGVCPLKTWPADAALQRIAAEKNLSEVAFFVPEGEGYRLRWFAPAAEVDLCGHATLAAAFVLYNALGHKKPSVRFDTKSGPLTVAREGERFALDFPVLDMRPCAAPPSLSAGLGESPRETYKSMDYVAVFDSEDYIRAIKPDLEALKRLDLRGVVVTAMGKKCDYVLRCFGPRMGIAEDPVTGSAQSMLAPYWAKRLQKTWLQVRQLSERGGELFCETTGNRVKIAGRASLHSKGEVAV